ncbi:hypothetical protein DFR86_01200 [Acidianus sulfidivorans JP7]|uniref:PaREP1 family protein n=1 Tax=Acidianus sulfidivorans JP7 TaxID=619593 RepID=A0A2U9IJT7_9CREN|nr:PaREP1 family protein [Acidianus sulfidivorans]AWR96293.1 hypothetical protein DFR86_01200 [Acidianus sulfidivorans JP7]
MKEVKIPDSLYEYLGKLGDNVEDSLVKIIINSIEDQTQKNNLVLSISDEYLRIGDDLKQRGDLINAGEYYWKALALIMQEVAEIMDLEIITYHDYFSLIDFLSYKTNDGELVINFSNAEKLHGEFHPRPQEEKSFEIREQNLKNLIQKLRKFLINN